MPKLIIQERGKNETVLKEFMEEPFTIGRLDDNSLKLGSEGVSRRHAKIVADGENFFLIDLKSGNGTYLNGRKLPANEKNLLKAGDIITIDAFDMTFHDGSAAIKNALAEEVTESDILEVKLLKKVLSALDKETVPSIEVLNGSAQGNKIFFTDEMNELVIGRDPECDFPVNEYVISRTHARIIKKWGGIIIRDLESKNGTFVNNRRVIEEYLHDGDRIALGTIVFIFRNPQEINLANITAIKPKHRPAQIKPKDIPGIEEASKGPPAPVPNEPAVEEPKAPKETIPTAGDEDKMASALDEWDNLEKSISKVEPYPTPEAKIEAIKKLTPVEIGMIGLGALVIIFAFITIVNLLAS